MLFQDLLPSSMISRRKFSGLFLGHAYFAEPGWLYLAEKKSLMDADNNPLDILK